MYEVSNEKEVNILPAIAAVTQVSESTTTKGSRYWNVQEFRAAKKMSRYGFIYSRPNSGPENEYIDR